MATFKAVVRQARKDGMYPVYIRVVHKAKPGYIKTDKVIGPKSLKKNGEIKDALVNEHCARLILEYTDRLNKRKSNLMSLSEVITYLTEYDSDLSFSKYARRHIDKMINDGHDRNAKNYKLALQNLEKYLYTNDILFEQLTSNTLRKWIESLRQTNRAKEMYPVCMRQIFKAALLDYNDEERGIVRIKFNPWPKVKIPKADKGEQRAISAEACREFFNRPLPESKMVSSLPELGRDVALMVLCLAGINTVDLYNMKKSNYVNGVLCYKRAKTTSARRDNAYIEVRVESFLLPVFEKYLAPEEDEYLFTFHKRYCDSDSFCANVNTGIKKICADMKMKKEDYYCVYTFRHTWATIAQNDCEASIHEVAFAMNHSHGFQVTRGYIKIDFTPVWILNAKVINFIFFSKEKSKQGAARDLNQKDDGKLFRISPKMMIYGRAYMKGEVVAEKTDIGFNTVEDVIKALASKLPKNLPTGCYVQFRITNCDKGTEVVYERTKGKGF